MKAVKTVGCLVTERDHLQEVGVVINNEQNITVVSGSIKSAETITRETLHESRNSGTLPLPAHWTPGYTLQQAKHVREIPGIAQIQCFIILSEYSQRLYKTLSSTAILEMMAGGKAWCPSNQLMRSLQVGSCSCCSRIFLVSIRGEILVIFRLVGRLKFCLRIMIFRLVGRLRFWLGIRILN